jgi:threonine/homoserine/homoserine lactone efflux protein
VEVADFVKGLFVGFFACSPIGPIGLLCVKRTLTHGRLAGLVSVLGASAVDGIYSFIAGFGITLISEALGRAHQWMHLAGGLIIAVVGIGIAFSRPPDSRNGLDKKSLWEFFLSAFLITLANPTPLLVFTAAFAALGLTGLQGNYVAATNVVLGVVVGSVLWAPVLALTAGAFAQRMGRMRLRLVNGISGVILAAFGAIVFLRTLASCFAQ